MLLGAIVTLNIPYYIKVVSKNYKNSYFTHRAPISISLLVYFYLITMYHTRVIV